MHFRQHDSIKILKYPVNRFQSVNTTQILLKHIHRMGETLAAERVNSIKLCYRMKIVSCTGSKSRGRVLVFQVIISMCQQMCSTRRNPIDHEIQTLSNGDGKQNAINICDCSTQRKCRPHGLQIINGLINSTGKDSSHFIPFS